MQGEEIKGKIASLPRGRYQFDLKGNLTPLFEENCINRFQQRKKYFFDSLLHLLGGSLSGKRVLGPRLQRGILVFVRRRGGMRLRSWTRRAADARRPS